MYADGLYLCDLCGKATRPTATRHTFLAAQYVGHRYRTPAIIMDFCSRAHARFYWRGSWFYSRMFMDRSARVTQRGVWYVAG